MKERTKHLLIGIVIGIVIGFAVFYLLLNFRIMQPFGPMGFDRPENITNFTRPFRQGMV